MARIAGINIPPHKHAEIGLTSIYGIGRTTAQKICDAAGIAYATKIKDLTDADLEKIRDEIGRLTIEGDLRRETSINNYGPYQFPEKLIPLLINNAKQHKNLPVYGDGMQIRDWLYVMDHCKAIDMVAQGGKDGEVYNVGGHNERPNIFIVKTVIAQLHDRLKDEGISEELITHVADRLGHDRRYGIDPTKIKEDLGWYPETPFEKGIVLTIDWYLAHPDWMAHVTSGDYQKYYEQMYKNK